MIVYYKEMLIMKTYIDLLYVHKIIVMSHLNCVE